MTRFQRWFFKRILKQELVQSPRHINNLVDIYALIVSAWCEEFTEDNTPVHKSMLGHGHRKAIDRVLCKDETKSL